MRSPSFVIGPLAVDTGTGSATTNTLLPVIDLSRCQSIRGTLSVTKAVTDAADTFDVYLQSLAQDGITWNDRAHWAQITGADTPAATTPEVRFINLQSDGIPLEASEEAYESSGSVGGTRLPAGTVRNGGFPAKQRGATGWVANWRIQVVTVDADVNADHEATIWLECH